MGVSSKSLLNLQPGIGVNKPRYTEEKKRRHLTVTNEGWLQTKALAKKEFGLSVSEMLEKIGRGEFKVVKVE